MPTPKYLQQVNEAGQGGYIYIFTEELSHRPDMRRITEKDANEELARQRKTKQDKLAEEQARTPKLPEAEEPSPQKEKPSVLDDAEPQKESEPQPEKRNSISTKGDPEIVKIRGMTKKNQVEQYVLQEFGVDVDRRLPLARLKKIAIEHRKTQLKAQS